MSGLKSAVLVVALASIAQTSSFSLSPSNRVRDISMKSLPSINDISALTTKCSRVLATSFIAFNLIGNFDVSSAKADDAVAATPAATVAASSNIDAIPKVPLYTKKGTDTQAYSDIGRGFRMLRLGQVFASLRR